MNEFQSEEDILFKVEEVLQRMSRSKIKGLLSSRDLLTGKAFCVLENAGGSGYQALLGLDDDLKRDHDEASSDNGFYYGVR